MTCKIRVLPYFLSQYFVFILIVLPFAFYAPRSKPHTAVQRKCQHSSSWDDSHNPDYFYHLTDIHISNYFPESYDILRNGLKVGSNYQSNSVFITGDVVDNYYYLKFPSKSIITRQLIEDWTNYSKIMNEFSSNFSLIIESLGNHDSLCTWSKDSNFNYAYYSQLSKIRNLTEEFDLILIESGNFTFLIMNPIDFPFSPLPLNYYVNPTKEYLDKIENVIDSISKNQSSKNLILGTHFHIPIWNWKTRSSRGHNIIDILNNPNIHLFISGHNHGDSHMIMHYNDSVEIAACDLRYSKMAGIITEDSQNVIFQYVNTTNPPPFFITYPSPIEQTSSRTPCSISKVRALVFEDLLPEDKKITFYIDSDSKNVQTLQRIREIKPHVWLYSADISFQNNNNNTDIHTINFSNSDKSYEYGFQFVYNENGEGIIPESQELIYNEFYLFEKREIGLLILLPILLFITFPWPILTFEDYFKWTIKQKSESSELLQWIISFSCVGAMRSRIMHLPKSFRILLFSTVIISFFIPYFTYEIEGHLCYIFSLGFYAKYWRTEMWSILSCFTFFSEVIFPIICFSSCIGLSYEYHSFSKVQFIDFILYILIIVRNIHTAIVPFVMLVGRKYPPYSAFFWMPLIWITIIIIYLCRYFHNILPKQKYQ